MNFAPIALFVYKRPEHTLRTLESLIACKHAEASRLTIFSDGPKAPADEAGVAEVRRVIRSKSWCREVEIVEQDRNRGLANSVIGGVTRLCDEAGRAIVIEDDLVLAPTFLTYMNESLDRYADEPRVMQVSGFNYNVKLSIAEDALFVPFTTSWGWATWKRAWDQFDPTASGYAKLASDRRLRRRFNLDGAYDFCELLEWQLRGQIDSWAIRWYLSVFLQNGLTLYPKSSLVRNLGFDGSGTHCGPNAYLDCGELTDFEVHDFPDIVECSPMTYKVIQSLSQPWHKRSLRRFVKTIRAIRAKTNLRHLVSQ